MGGDLAPGWRQGRGGARLHAGDRSRRGHGNGAESCLQAPRVLHALQPLRAVGRTAGTPWHAAAESGDDGQGRGLLQSAERGSRRGKEEITVSLFVEPIIQQVELRGSSADGLENPRRNPVAWRESGEPAFAS